MNHTVLYIEDNPLNIRLVQKSLRDVSVVVNIAQDGDEGLKWLKNNTTHLVLLDMNLPSVNGIDVLRQMKINHRTRHIPVIALTADNSVQTRRACETYGVADYLEKPVSRHTLIQSIQTVLSDVALH